MFARIVHPPAFRPGGRFLLLVLLILASPAPAGRASTTEPGDAPIRLTVHVVDGTTGRPTAARIRVVSSAGADVCPLPEESNFYHAAYTGHRFFYAEGDFDVQVPGGSTAIWVSKGPEFQACMDTCEVVADSSGAAEHTVVLSRFADMPAYGWRSGDTHVHRSHSGTSVYLVNNPDAFMIQKAEDLHVVNLLQDRDEFTGSIEPESTPDYLQYIGGEYRSAFWGHVDVLGVATMPYLFCCSMGQPAWPMIADLVRDTRSRGGMAFFAHPITVPRSQIGITDQGWPSVGHGRELPIDVALGTVDAIDVFSYSNMNRIETSTWFDLLDHGFRIPATAGTDASVNVTSSPFIGGYRVYGRVGPGPFTYDAWLESLRRGESFVTSGPLIREFTVDGRPAGSVFETSVAGSHSVPVTFDVVCQWPMDYVAIVMNGRYRYFYPTGDRRSLSVSATVDLSGESSWVLVAAAGSWSNPGPFFTVTPEFYAFSNPVYVDVPGHPLRFAGSDPFYYLHWVDDVFALADARGWNAPSQRDTVLARVRQAEQILMSRTAITPTGVPLPAPGQPGGEPTVTAQVDDREVRFRFTNVPAAPETFELFDVQGRALYTRRLEQTAVDAGGWVWRKDELAARPAPGVYFVRFRGNGWTARTRVVLT